MKIVTLVVTYNSRSYVDRLCESLLNQDYDLSKVLLILIDNNSIDDTYERFVRCLEDAAGSSTGINYVAAKLGSNIGFAPANNIGIILSKYILNNISNKIFLFINPDTYILTRDFFSRAERILRVLPVVGFSTVSGSNDNVFIDGIGAFVDYLGNPLDLLCCVKLTEKLKRNLLDKLPVLYMMPSVCFAAVGIRGDVFDRLGLLRNEYVIYFEDTEYALRAWSSSIPVYVYREFMVWHARGGTQRGARHELSPRRGRSVSDFVSYHFAKNQLLLTYEYFGYFRYLARLFLYSLVGLLSRRSHLAFAAAESLRLILRRRVRRRRLPRGLVPFDPRTWVLLWALKYILAHRGRGAREAVSYAVKRASLEYIKRRFLLRRF